MVNRICSKCKVEKPLDNFPKDRLRSLGYGYWCKECKYSWYRNDYKPSNKKYSSPIASFAQKQRARALVNRAIMHKRMERCPCVKCGNLKSEAHHEDYLKPLEVVWLCDIHHREVHQITN